MRAIANTDGTDRQSQSRKVWTILAVLAAVLAVVAVVFPGVAWLWLLRALGGMLLLGAFGGALLAVATILVRRRRPDDFRRDLPMNLRLVSGSPRRAGRWNRSPENMLWLLDFSVSSLRRAMVDTNTNKADSQSRMMWTILAILGAVLAIVGWWRWAS